MPTWAQRGLQTALVTGGLLMLGTSIASASENVNPDRPASPIDGGLDAPLHNDTTAPAADTLAGDLTAPATLTAPVTEEAHALDAQHAQTQAAPIQAAPSGVATTELGQVEHVIDAGLAGGGVDSTATRTGGDVTPSSEWGVLSGDLLPPADPTLFRVPLSVVGRAVEHNAPTAPATEEEPQFGPSDAADSLLGANQVPVIGDLFTVPNVRNVRLGAPLSTLDQTQQFPAIGRFGMPELGATQQFPAVGGFSDITRQLPVINDGFLLPAQRATSRPAIRPVSQARQSPQDMAAMPAGRYQPMTGNLPAAGRLPTPSVPTLPTAGLPGLPTLPTPGMPGRPGLPTGGVPALPNASAPTLPAGAPPVSANLPTVNKPSLPAVGQPNIALPNAALPNAALPNAGVPNAGLPSTSLPATGALPLGGVAPTFANPQAAHRPSVQAQPTASLPALPAPALPSLPTAGVPALVNGSAPSLPTTAVPAFPNTAFPNGALRNTALPNAALPNAALPNTSLPNAALPNAALPRPAVPTLPAPSLSRPAVPALPALPTTSLPLAGAVSPQSAPALPGMPALPDLPPVPTLPAMPPLPATQAGPASLPGLPHVPTPALSGPSMPALPSLAVPGGLFTPAVPATQDLPAGSAQQLMAQLRDLISDLENSASGAPARMHPMQEPPAL